MEAIMTTGIVLEGGAMRGMYTAGVLDVIMENKLEFDYAVGVSAGATFGCNLVSRQIGRTIRYNVRFAKDPRYGSFRSLIKTGDFYGADFCYRTLPEKLDVFDTDAIESNPLKFYVVTTDIDTGLPCYHKLVNGKHNDLDWTRASASMPVFSRPVELEGKRMLDGGMSDAIPVHFMEQLGADKIVVVLTQPREYLKPGDDLKRTIKFLSHKYPKLAETMEKRPAVYNETLAYIAYKEKKGELFVIRPPKKLEIGKIEHDPEKMEEVYRIGRDETMRRLDNLKSYLEQ